MFGFDATTKTGSIFCSWTVISLLRARKQRRLHHTHWQTALQQSKRKQHPMCTFRGRVKLSGPARRWHAYAIVIVQILIDLPLEAFPCANLPLSKAAWRLALLTFARHQVHTLDHSLHLLLALDAVCIGHVWPFEVESWPQPDHQNRWFY